MQKHLICHLWPGREHGTWKRTLHHLRARIDLFDGVRQAAIMDGPECDAFECGKMLADLDIDHRVFPNDKSLGEGVGFPFLLSKVANEPGQTFYCHSKGASHPPGSMSERWADVMFHLCLDYPGLVGAALQDYRIAGSFKRVEQRMGVPWHYSGTFFWFNAYGHQQLCATDRNCVERWPASLYKPSEGADLGLADCRNLYDEINWRSWITMRFRREILWNQQRREMRARAGTRWQDLPENNFEPLQVIYDECR